MKPPLAHMTAPSPWHSPNPVSSSNGVNAGVKPQAQRPNCLPRGSPKPQSTTTRSPSRHPAMFLAHHDRQNVNFLFRRRQPRNNCCNFIEYLVPALQLTAVFRAFHGFISNEGELRLAVPEILKEGHVVRAVDGLMFYS